MPKYKEERIKFPPHKKSLKDKTMRHLQDLINARLADLKREVDWYTQSERSHLAWQKSRLERILEIKQEVKDYEQEIKSR